eukprot:11744055-Karenia_brevis.AAC.1
MPIPGHQCQITLYLEITASRMLHLHRSACINLLAALAFGHQHLLRCAQIRSPRWGHTFTMRTRIQLGLITSWSPIP